MMVSQHFKDVGSEGRAVEPLPSMDFSGSILGTFSTGKASCKEECSAWIYFAVTFLFPSANTKENLVANKTAGNMLSIVRCSDTVV